MSEPLGELYFSVRAKLSDTDADLAQIQQKYTQTISAIEHRAVKLQTIIDDPSLQTAISKIQQKLADVGKIKVTLDTSGLQGQLGGMSVGGLNAPAAHQGGGLLEGLLAGVLAGHGSNTVENLQPSVTGGGKGVNYEPGEFPAAAKAYINNVLGASVVQGAAAAGSDTPGFGSGSGSYSMKSNPEMFSRGMAFNPLSQNIGTLGFNPAALGNRASNLLSGFGINASPGIIGGVAALLAADKAVGFGQETYYHDINIPAQQGIDPTAVSGYDTIAQESYKRGSNEAAFTRLIPGWARRANYSVVRNIPFVGRYVTGQEEAIDSSNEAVRLQQQKAQIDIPAIREMGRQYVGLQQGAISLNRRLSPDEQMMEYDQQTRELGLEAASASGERQKTMQRLVRFRNEEKETQLGQISLRENKLYQFRQVDESSLWASTGAQALRNNFKPIQGQIQDILGQEESAIGGLDPSQFSSRKEFEDRVGALRNNFSMQIRGVDTQFKLASLSQLGQQVSSYLNFGGPGPFESMADIGRAKDQALNLSAGMHGVNPGSTEGAMVPLLRETITLLQKVAANTAGGVRTAR